MKVLTVENWLQPDYVNLLFGDFDRNAGVVRPMSGEDFLRGVLEPKLDPIVPTQIRRLFEVGRGIMAYGYFFYPLYSAGTDELYRVAEAAVRLRVRQQGGPTHLTFEKSIDWLSDNNALNDTVAAKWHILRDLRNKSSHRDRPTMFPQGFAVSLAKTVAEDINGLYGVPQRPVRPHRESGKSKGPPRA